jgi:peptidyl-prolyl cis-trans isomerase SurA
MNRKTPLLKNLKMLLCLQQGEISEPFETDFGFHIIYVEKIKGQEIELRHILLTPSVSEEAQTAARENQFD